jgi:hypothetical protein
MKITFTPANCLLILGLVAGTRAFAQQPVPAYQLTDKEREKLNKEIAKSKEKNDSFWDYDTVYSNGAPYCLLYKVDKGALTHDDYSVRSLSGQEIIYVKYGMWTDYNAPHAPNTSPPTYGYYTYYFPDTKRTAETGTNRPFKELVRNGLIQNGTQVDPDNETKFCALYPPKYSIMVAPPVAPPPSAPPPYIMTNRNRGGGISIFGSNVRQDGADIGTISYADNNVNGHRFKTMTVFLPNGCKVADVSNSDVQPHVWTVITTRDGLQGSISSSNGQDNMDLVKYLIAGNYL